MRGKGDLDVCPALERVLLQVRRQGNLENLVDWAEKRIECHFSAVQGLPAVRRKGDLQD